MIREIRWKKNLPQIAWVTGITVPKYFAVESMQTNMKKPPAANKITLNNGVCFGTVRFLITLQRLLAKD